MQAITDALIPHNPAQAVQMAGHVLAAALAISALVTGIFAALSAVPFVVPLALGAAIIGCEIAAMLIARGIIMIRNCKESPFLNQPRPPAQASVLQAPAPSQAEPSEPLPQALNPAQAGIPDAPPPASNNGDSAERPEIATANDEAVPKDAEAEVSASSNSMPASAANPAAETSPAASLLGMSLPQDSLHLPASIAVQPQPDQLIEELRHLLDAIPLTKNMPTEELQNVLKTGFSSNGIVDKIKVLRSMAPKQLHQLSKAWLTKSVHAVFPSCFAFFITAQLDSPEWPQDQLSYSGPSAPLNPQIFRWAKTLGVAEDILKASKSAEAMHFYAVASQYNSTEASHRFTPAPGEVMDKSASDPTQGPAVQRTNPRWFELVNAAANIGLNGLISVLSPEVRGAVVDGYLIARNQAEATIVAKDFEARWQDVEQTCVGSIPDGEGCSNQVYLMLGAAPAFGNYPREADVLDSDPTSEASRTMQFKAALANYTAQFRAVLHYIKTHPTVQVVYHPIALGCGFFGNDPALVGKAFHVAAYRFHTVLLTHNLEKSVPENLVQVQFEVFQDSEGKLSLTAMTCAQAAGFTKENEQRAWES